MAGFDAFEAFLSLHVVAPKVWGEIKNKNDKFLPLLVLQ
jgi:hypothetical protein